MGKSPRKQGVSGPASDSAMSQQRGKTDFDALRMRQEANENDVDTSDIPQLPEELLARPFMA